MVSRRNVYSSIDNLIGKKGEVFIYLFYSNKMIPYACILHTRSNRRKFRIENGGRGGNQFNIINTRRRIGNRL